MTHSGWHFLQIPGPTNVPDRVLRAMARPVIDHRGPEFAALTLELIGGLRTIFKTSGPIVMYPSSGSGASEAALVNTLSPGDRVVIFETGHFSAGWKKIAERLGLRVDYVPGNWRRGASDVELESRLAADAAHEIKAVVVVHNETSTGVASRIADLRRAMNRASHPALLIVDAVSSLASFDYRHDEWGVDVTVCGSQKGLMVPPGIGFVAVSEKARRAGKTATLPRAYWEWEEIIKQNEAGFFPYTPPTNLFYGLREALLMLEEEGLSNIFSRHARHAEATRAAVRAWGLELVCEDPREYSSSMTAIFLPEGHNADRLREIILERFNMSLGIGLSKLSGRVFRIGHLGSFNDLMLMGTLSGVEMGLRLAGVPHKAGGVMAAIESVAPAHAAVEAAQVR
jgi:alanine-glyoxylate transaminase / serine-glyoxylate transaminase / serine-pyruvate transaminase